MMIIEPGLNYEETCRKCADYILFNHDPKKVHVVIMGYELYQYIRMLSMKDTDHFPLFCGKNIIVSKDMKNSIEVCEIEEEKINSLTRQLRLVKERHYEF